MPKRNLRITEVAVSLCVFGLLTACDTDADPDADTRANLTAEVTPVNGIEPGDWEAVTWPPLPSHLGIQAPEQQQTPATWPWTVETFVFSTTELIAVTTAAGGLFTPSPVGIPTLDEPAIASGAIFAAKFRDVNDDIIAFGTEQEVVDFVNAEALTTYTLTIPGRGTLMLKQTEDISGLLDEVNDMIANAEFIRTFDPPLEIVSTIPGTGLIVGGSDEFSCAHGYMQETNILSEINLIDGTIDDEVVLQVIFL